MPQRDGSSSYAFSNIMISCVLTVAVVYGRHLVRIARSLARSGTEPSKLYMQLYVIWLDRTDETLPRVAIDWLSGRGVV